MGAHVASGATRVTVGYECDRWVTNGRRNRVRHSAGFIEVMSRCPWIAPYRFRGSFRPDTVLGAALGSRGTGLRGKAGPIRAHHSDAEPRRVGGPRCNP